MVHEFEQERMVEFAETDTAGIAHFSNFFRWMEATEHAFFRSLGFSVHRLAPDGTMRGWVRVRAECNYRRPLFYEDRFVVRLLVRAKSERSIRYAFAFRAPAGSPDATTVAVGDMHVVCVEKRPDDERPRAVPMPAEIAAQIDVAPAELIDALESRYVEK